MIDKNLFKLLGKNKKYLFIIVFLMIIGLFANLGFSAMIALTIYYASINSDFDKYIMPIGVAVGCIIIRYLIHRITVELKDLLSRNVKKDLREKGYEKIISLNGKTNEDIGVAGLTQVLMEGVEQIDLYYSEYLPQFFYAMLAPFILFGVTVWMNYRPSLALICFVPLIPASIIFVSKYAKKVFAKYWGKYISMGDSFLDSVNGLKELKIFRADQKRQIKMNESAEEFRHITMKVLIMQLASTTIMDLVAYGGAGIGLTIALFNYKDGIYNDGVVPALFAIIFMILVAVEFFLPMRRFGSAFHTGMNGASAGRKIISLLNMEECQWNNEKIDSYDIKIKDLTFTYDGNRDVLNNINMEFNKGLNSIVGESGSGKSTIVKLIMGTERTNIGTISIGNKNLESLSRIDYYNHLAIVSYDSYIFNESIFDNFKNAKLDVKEDEIWNSLKLVNLDNFVKNNGGLDKVINEDSANISGGERQRLSLAINLITNKDIYIFDEATSNIDIDSEKIIMDNIIKLSKDKTVILISHRLKNVIESDNIYYLEDGYVKEAGNHNELIKLNGGYNKLFNTQKSLEEGFKDGDLNA